MKYSVGCRIAINTRNGSKLPVTVMVRFNSLYDWCFQAMWLFSGAPADPENETVMK